METVASILYARVRNAQAAYKAMSLEQSAEFTGELRNMLEGPIAKHNGKVAQIRQDSILALFTDAPEDKPDHARRALNAAVAAVHAAAGYNRRMASRTRSQPLAPVTLSAGVHLGKVEIASGRAGSGGAVRASGEVVEIARVLECTAPDLGWSVVSSGLARRAAGGHVESGRFGSVALPDSSFVDVVEITGLSANAKSPTTPAAYQALRESIKLNQRLGRPQDLAATMTGTLANAPTHFSVQGYRIVRKIGEGGMASIYLAQTDQAEDLQVLKVMSLAGSDEGDALQRFMQEFALLAQVKDANVAKIHRQSFSAGHAYIAMEYFSHGDLRTRIGKGIDPRTAIAYAKQIAGALRAIHGAAIVHRDLKPANLMLRGDGSLALADFGIAKHVSMLLTDTAHDEVVGTPQYLSPEQVMGQPVDSRCDLYSLGIILYEMLEGARPYRADSVEALLELHLNSPVPQLRPAFRRLQPVLDRLMAKDREQRYADAQQFLTALKGLGL